jgi:predicted DNA-binding transcriptional regulator YafY
MSERWAIRWDLLLRYRLIEIIGYWEGRLTTNHLTRSFGIGRQQASKDINNYLRDIAPGNLYYDKYIKGYRPADHFEPRVTSGVADEYLHLLNRNQELSNTFEALSLQVANTEVLGLPVRAITPGIIRPIVTASRLMRRLEVDYVSVHNPDREGRIIVPHTLVFTGSRWHVRAFCEKNQDFRDFVLSRFRGDAEMLDDSPNNESDDAAWHTPINVLIRPDPRLTSTQQEVVAHDYGMTNNQLNIPTRGALVHYVLEKLGLRIPGDGESPEAQQIVVENAKQLQPWLFE